ncbi:MAG: hypoxanthine phosphoribosyltransferase [Armatimonadetes bacterium]|nr:hypoxanthine phosphoribosyltransferase [Armatimonadota bacterium]
MPGPDVANSWPPPVKRILLTADQIQERVSQLAAQLQRDYAGRRPLLVAVLRGSVVFLSDLIRHLNMPVCLDFVQLASYGDSTCSSGQVEVLKDLGTDIAGQDVVVVEDIVDTGRTLAYLVEELERRGAASVKVCALLDKPSRREVPVRLDYVGFEVPDCFVVGYGLDFAGQYRNLPYVAELSPQAYAPQEE